MEITCKQQKKEMETCKQQRDMQAAKRNMQAAKRDQNAPPTGGKCATYRG